MNNRLYFNTAIKQLENKNNFLVWYFPWNSDIRNYHGDEIGQISTKVTQKLIDSGRLRFSHNGEGLLNHEKYYKLIL